MKSYKRNKQNVTLHGSELHRLVASNYRPDESEDPVARTNIATKRTKEHRSFVTNCRDFRLHNLQKFAWPLIGVAGFTLMLTFLIVTTWSPSYRSNTVVLINEAHRFDDALLDQDALFSYGEERLFALSKPLLKRVEVIRMIDRVSKRLGREVPENVVSVRKKLYMELLNIYVVRSEFDQDGVVNLELKLGFKSIEPDVAQMTAIELSRALNSVLSEAKQQINRTGSSRLLPGTLENGSAPLDIRMRVLVPPNLPDESHRSKRYVIASIGIFLAIGLSLAVFYILVSNDRTVYGDQDIVQLLDVEPLANIPYIVNSEDRERQRVRFVGVGMITLLIVVLGFVIFWIS